MVKHRLTLMSAMFFTIILSAVAVAQPRPEGDGDRRRAPMPPAIRVSGEGIVEAKPDRATVHVGATAQAKDASEAQKLVNETVRKTIEALKAMGIADEAIQTAGISLHPVYSNQHPEPVRGGDHEPKITGYRATNRVSVRVDDVSQVGPVIDTAVATGGNTIDGIHFELKDDAPQRRQALKEAAEEARAKAEAIADAMELDIVGVEEVVEGGVESVYPMQRRGMAVMAAAEMGTPVEPGQVETRASLTVTYRVRETGAADSADDAGRDDQ